MSYPTIFVRPATNPETGEIYRTWHPTQFRQPLPATGGLVPNDPTFTGRYLRDGLWIKCDPPAPPKAAEPEAPAPEPKRVRAADKTPASDD